MVTLSFWPETGGGWWVWWWVVGRVEEEEGGMNMEKKVGGLEEGGRTQA